MSSLFVSSTTAATRHGVFGIERPAPTVIQGIGTGVAACVGQFPWGPTAELVTPVDTADLINKFLPTGCERANSTGYAAIAGKTFPLLKIVRVVGDGAAAAAATFPEDATDIATVTAKYPGVLGNSLAIDITDASDADADHFDLTVTLSGSSGTYSETFKNIDFSAGTGGSVDVSESLLLASITQDAAGRPDNVEASLLADGADGTITASEYIGTAGAPDEGLSLLETDTSIRHVFVDDCGNSLRAAVNAGLQAHALLMGDRVAYVNGDKSLSASAAETLIGTFASDRVVVVPNWVKQYVDSVLIETVPAPFAACVAAKVPPSLSIAWKGKQIGSYLSGIKGLVTKYGNAIPQLSEAGGAVLIQETDGSFRFEAGVVADGTLLTTRRTKDYIVVSAALALRPYVDSPNIGEIHDEEVTALSAFLADLVTNQSSWASLPFIVEFAIGNVDAENSEASLANGDFKIPFSVKTAADQSRIFLLATIGPTVTVTEQPE